MSSLWRSACLVAFTYFILLDSSLDARSACHSDDDDGDWSDIGSKTVRATVVFEGEARGWSSPPDQPHLNIVDFKVHRVLKGDGVKGSQHVRVGYFDRSYGTVGSRYLVFVHGPSNSEDNRSSRNSTARLYHMSSLPEEFSNKALKEVRNHACAKCVRSPKIAKESKSVEVIEGQRLRLHCRASGRPSPCITWYKDGAEVKADSSSSTAIKENRRDSRLQIKIVGVSDSGVYRCQATNLLGNSSSREIAVTVRTVTLKPHSNLCRNQNYCLNGGTCYEVSQLKKQYCECAKNFVGKRCEEKFAGRGVQVVSGKGEETYHKRRKRKRWLDGHQHQM